MRIIAGTHRGRRIASPRGCQTRPITDRVKQSLFDRLASGDRLENGVVLDIFAGTGSLGLECLSRGASHVTFVELDRSASQLLEQNLAMLGERDSARVLRSNVLSLFGADVLGRRDYSLVFLDPPYPMVRDLSRAGPLWRVAGKLGEVCSENAMLVLRLERHASPPNLAGWCDPASHPYGSMTLHLYSRETRDPSAGYDA